MTKKTKKTPRWRATVGLSFPDGVDVDQGKLVPKEIDVPDWMIEQQKVEEA